MTDDQKPHDAPQEGGMAKMARQWRELHPDAPQEECTHEHKTKNTYDGAWLCNDCGFFSPSNMEEWEKELRLLVAEYAYQSRLDSEKAIAAYNAIVALVSSLLARKTKEAKVGELEWVLKTAHEIYWDKTAELDHVGLTEEIMEKVESRLASLTNSTTEK